MHQSSSCLLLAAALLVSIARVNAADFSLYAYGPGIEGYPVVYKDGAAYIFKGNISQSTEYTPVTCNGTGFTSLTGNPDNATTSDSMIVDNVSWSNELFFISPNGSEQVGFTSSASDGQYTSVFRFFGETTLAYVDDSYQTPFTAVNVTDGIWQLNWDDASGTNVALRRDSLQATSGKN